LEFEEAIMNAFKPRANAKILVDGGDPEETVRVKHLVGYVDGQTTNPTLVSKNPEVRTLVSSGQKFSSREELDEYKKIVQTISPLVGDAGVSIEVFADFDTTGEEMLAQGREMFSWIPNAYVKYPCTHEGLRAAQMSVRESMRVNMTLCFSQEQAAAVYAATKGSHAPVYVSPFVGRLDDRGENGMDLVKNIKQMYEAGDGHVYVLAASIRHLNHLLGAFALRAELVTAPAKVWEEWVTSSFALPGEGFVYQATDKADKPLKPIAYKSVDLNRPWESFDIHHALTTKGIQQFVADYKSTLKQSASGPSR
jgi:transaldolase